MSFNLRQNPGKTIGLFAIDALWKFGGKFSRPQRGHLIQMWASRKPSREKPLIWQILVGELCFFAPNEMRDVIYFSLNITQSRLFTKCIVFSYVFLGSLRKLLALYSRFVGFEAFLETLSMLKKKWMFRTQDEMKYPVCKV